jgi:hypothetical protein
VIFVPSKAYFFWRSASSSSGVIVRAARVSSAATPTPGASPSLADRSEANAVNRQSWQPSLIHSRAVGFALSTPRLIRTTAPTALECARQMSRQRAPAKGPLARGSRASLLLHGWV